MVCRLNIVNKKKYPLTDELKNKLKKITQLVEENTSLDERKKWFLNLILVDEAESQQLNKQYRQKNYPADVLTFPFACLYQEKLNNCDNLGDIFLCYPIVKKQVHEFQVSFKEEICLIFTHGMLHLLGYDHQKEVEKKTMFALQEKILIEIKYTKNFI